MRLKAFSIEIDPLSMEDAVAAVRALAEKADGSCRYVVTPNVDHLVTLHGSAAFREAYSNASLVLTDGRPVHFALKLLGRPVPETVPGSDLVPRLFESYNGDGRSVKVFWLGAAPGVAERAAARVSARWPSVESVGWFSPPLGFESDEEENKRILAAVNGSSADILLVGLGAPKQELWVHAHRERIRVPAALCVGATIDFLAGEKRRAPMWMRRLSLEWLYRMLSDPRRLVKRYAVDGLMFPVIVWKEWRASAGAGRDSGEG